MYKIIMEMFRYKYENQKKKIELNSVFVLLYVFISSSVEFFLFLKKNIEQSAQRNVHEIHFLFFFCFSIII